MIELLMTDVAGLTFDMGVFFMDLGSLTKAGLLFMHTLRHDDTGICWAKLQLQRIHCFHSRDKRFIPAPSSVKCNVINQRANQIKQLPHVWHNTIEGFQLENRQAKWSGFVCFFGVNGCRELP